MKKFSVIMLALALALGLAFVGCDNGGDDPNATKFEGSWYYREPSSPTRDYVVMRFAGDTITVRWFVNGEERSQIVGAEAGTFTFTDTVITWIAPPGATWGTFSSDYVLTGNSLILPRSAFHGKSGTYVKE